MLELKYHLEETSEITSNDTDFKGKLKLSALMNFLIQIAWHHAEQLGWGAEALHQHGLAWVMSKMKIQINQVPNWGESIHITTWPKGIDRLFYLRDFLVTDLNGNELVRASSSWLTIDIERRRPRLHDSDSDVFKQNLEQHAIEEKIINLPALEKPDGSMEFQARYSDIDINKHLTAVRYIDWMMNTLSVEFHEKYSPQEFTINYLKEVHPDQHMMVLSKLLQNDTLVFEGKKSDNGASAVRAELKFR